MAGWVPAFAGKTRSCYRVLHQIAAAVEHSLDNHTGAAAR
jgi:hypothetical protein